MANPRDGDRKSRWLVVASVGVGVILGTTVAWGLPELFPATTRCVLGAEIGSASIWTPSVLVNVPLGGSAAFGARYLNWTFSSGSVTVGAPWPENGGMALYPGHSEVGINGVLGLANWSFYVAENRSQAFGASDPCTQPYVTAISSSLTCATIGNLSTVLVLPDNSSDAVQPHTVPPQPCSYDQATPGASLWFDTSFHASGSSGQGTSVTLNLCGPAFTAPLNVSVTSRVAYPIEVNMSLNGRVVTAFGNVLWNGPAGLPVGVPTAEYLLPQGWIWNVSSIGSGTLPTVESPVATALLAFERTPC